MNRLADSHQELLKKVMNPTNVSLSQYPYFIKGDISGIQTFIFYIQSKHAAKVLKGRSFFIQAVADIAVQHIVETLGESNVEIIYNGGGNFYLLSKVKPDLTPLVELINRDCRDDIFYLYLTTLESVEPVFGERRKALEKEAQVKKLVPFNGDIVAFQPLENKTRLSGEDWRSWTSQFVRHNGFEIQSTVKDGKAISKQEICLFGKELILTDSNEILKKSIVNKLPLWDKKKLDKWHELVSELEKEEAIEDIPRVNTIIEFSVLAAFAKERTGTAKLGVLKMDIDNLGELFNGLSDLTNARKASQAMKWFFDDFFQELLAEEIDFFQRGNTVKATYGENLYVVFSGGDDCFVIGAWDAVFSFAERVRKGFAAFVDFISKEIVGLPNSITLSAGLIMVNPKFPMIRLAKLAEAALEAAKHKTESKNSICVFGKVLSWKDYYKAKAVAFELAEMVHNGEESRSILERIKASSRGYERLEELALEGNLSGPKAWRLFYFLRNVKNKERIEKLIIRDYANALIQAFNAQETKNPMVFPIAARWAEFLTKQKEKKNGN